MVSLEISFALVIWSGLFDMVGGGNCRLVSSFGSDLAGAGCFCSGSIREGVEERRFIFCYGGFVGTDWSLAGEARTVPGWSLLLVGMV